MNKIAHNHPLHVVNCETCSDLQDMLKSSKKGLPLKDLAENIGLSKVATLAHLHSLECFFGIFNYKPRRKRRKWQFRKPKAEQLRFGKYSNRKKKRTIPRPHYVPEIIFSTSGLYYTKGTESLRELFVFIWWILKRISIYSWWPRAVLSQKDNTKKDKILEWRGTPRVAWYGDIIYFGSGNNKDAFANKLRSLRKISKDLGCAVVLISTESITHEEYINKVEKELVGDTE